MPYGHYDVPLADTFATEVAQLRAKLPPFPHRIFSSPPQRCLALAEAIVTDNDIIFEERLREINFGIWENRLWTELPRAETEPWMADSVTLAPPTGETFGAVQQWAAFLTKLMFTAAEEPTLIFTHGGTIRALVCHCLQLPLRNAFQLQIDYASVTRLRLEHARWQLVKLNQ